MQFLMGLHDSFNSERSQILMLDLLPDIERTFSMVYAVEEQRAVQTNLEANSNHMACQLTLNEEARGGLQQKKAFVDKRNAKKKGKTFAANVDVRNEETSKGQSQNVVEIVAEVLKRMQKESAPSDPLTNYAHYAQFDEDFAGNVVIPTEINKFCWIIDTGATNHYLNLSIYTDQMDQKGLFSILALTPTKLLDWKTPYEKLTGNPPQYEHLRTFGALCYATDNTPHRSKFQSRVLRCILIGYAMHKKAYKLFDLDNQAVIFSRDVQFYENMFPFSSTQPINSSLALPTVPLQLDNMMSPAPQATDLAEQINDHTSNPTSAPQLHDDGTVERYKARLVTKGFTQIASVDYTDNFSPVAKTITVHLFLALATVHGWPLHQIDVNNAFLHGHLEEDLYMIPPEGYTVAPGLVCQLNRSIYGLKQASYQWNAELTLKLIDFGFTQSAHDHCLFTKATSAGIMALLLYVDDILVAAPTVALIQSIKDYLHSLFTIKDLGDDRYFLGLEVARNSDGIYVAQTK
ncbi:UNVERIFIED_CONTAM: putative transposon Ty5-1 protein [Sesamum radiatum]|uniref:Transposon Ty5-1 protein n=1 Tax=Sesamum radiatum TaxID=300843 RepID=A0AAW2U9D7_SESRA